MALQELCFSSDSKPFGCMFEGLESLPDLASREIMLEGFNEARLIRGKL